MNYRPYNKQSIIAVMKHRDNRARLLGEEKKPSFWDVSKWSQWWQSGAKELEKTAPGKLITAPIRIPEAIVTSSKKIIEETPKAFSMVTKTLPLMLIVGGVGVGLYYVNKAGLLKKIKGR